MKEDKIIEFDDEELLEKIRELAKEKAKIKKTYVPNEKRIQEFERSFYILERITNAQVTADTSDPFCASISLSAEMLEIWDPKEFKKIVQCADNCEFYTDLNGITTIAMMFYNMQKALEN